MFETRRANAKDKVIVTAAVCGAVPTKADNPNLPTQPRELADSIIECYKAGAAVAHIHVRDDQDNPTMNIDKFTETVNLVREAMCPIILNLTTSGAPNVTDEERMMPFVNLRPELASFDAGTMNWLHSSVFVNEPQFLEKLGLKMQAVGVKPEIEVFDMGMLNTALYYLKKGILKAPLHFQICLGAPGGLEANVESLLYVVNHLPENCTWGTFGIGKGAMEITLAALSLGGNIRTGFEDNVYFNKGELAKSNAQFVTRIADLAKLANKQLATPDEAREILGLK
ncbi:beta-keto acid cleavage family enzyme [Fusibacter ferrireducens]|uniref:3-keto-5-aminohexanoate cleavage protein n=1 Tax=Fusibacter ferrireducens TaxID=2785058 RepID=A0ABR9ZW93_9FIRM|nr:3-keto-5-aminohexanoate cleavage protein [Fusibacter ferrireducens]MBF4694721.1 3-keto-5-aminohexanoate cleavage protein [Fusibacter ferrireducens]